MSMRDYEDLKDIEIPRKQEMMMDIMCKAWEECRELHCVSCPDRRNGARHRSRKEQTRMNNYEEEHFGDFVDFWDDTPEFDAQIEEFKTALRADIKRETKELIE